MIVSLHEGENQIGSREKRDEALRFSGIEMKGISATKESIGLIGSPGKRGRSTKDLRYRDRGNLNDMGSTASKVKVKMVLTQLLKRSGINMKAETVD